MNELALFAGAGGGILGGRLLGWRTVCAVEWDPYAASVLVARQNDKTLEPFPIWDDVQTFDGRPWRGIVDVVSGGFPCFGAGTLILTRRGYIPIESVSTEDFVLTHLGRWRRVTSVMQKEDGELFRVKGMGILDTITTSEHPYWAREKYRTWNNETRRYEWNFSDPSWTEVRNFGKRTYLSEVLPNEEPDDHSPEFWWLVGRYLADGWRVDRAGRENGRVVICCGKHEFGVLEQRIPAAGFNFSRVEERTTFKYHITEGRFYEELKDFGRLAHGKLLPAKALCLNQEKSQKLFEGWCSGDGWRNTRQGISGGSTVSGVLALSLAIVARRASGRVASVHTSRKNRTCVIEGRVCNQRDVYDVRLCDRNKLGFEEGSYGWKPLRKAERLGIVGRVYNISVEEDESYVANGAIVHNCQDLSAAGKGAGITGEKSGMWKHMARIIGEVRPRYAFVENSPMLTCRGLGTVLGDLAEMGYNAEWCVLGASDVGAPHKRERIWILAYDTSFRATWVETGEQKKPKKINIQSIDWWSSIPMDLHPFMEWRFPEGGSDACRNDNDLAIAMDRIERIGNGQVPAVAAAAWNILMERINAR